jgi:hypothetical protein
MKPAPPVTKTFMLPEKGKYIITFSIISLRYLRWNYNISRICQKNSGWEKTFQKREKFFIE